MIPVGDKVVLKKVDLDKLGKGARKGEILMPSGATLCEVCAVGKGIPYGRGEFYALTLTPSELVLVPEDTWRKAPSVRLRVEGEERPVEHRIFHEREVLMSVDLEEL